MAHARTYEGVVLRTLDVGEADRFCIVFTREMGRKAARARAVRRLGSRLGGLILPFQHISLEIVENETSATITSATNLGTHRMGMAEYPTFLRLERGIELVLALTEDHEPLPQVFTLLTQFLSCCTGLWDPLPAFTLRLVAALGLLPMTTEDPRFAHLSLATQAFVQRCAEADTLATMEDRACDLHELQIFLSSVLLEHLARPLKSVVLAGQ